MPADDGPRGDLPFVSVVIPTMGGRARILERALPVLLADEATAEVIVVLGREDPETEALIDRVEGSDGRLRTAGPPRPADPVLELYQLARDAGAAARGEVILCFDDDLEPIPGLVAGHAARHRGTDDLVVLGYTPVRARDDGEGSLQATQLYSANYERACDRFREDPDAILTSLWGGQFSVRRERWLRAARYRSLVGAGYKVDQEFGLLLREGGARGIFEPELEAVHRHSSSAQGLVRNARSQGFGQVRLHAAYPDAVRSPDELLAEASPWVRPLLAISRSRAGWLGATRAIQVAAKLAEWCRLGRIENAALRALGRMAFARGAREGQADARTA